MKCPKCGYLGFERPERCRNCGYEFVLSSRQSEPELTLRDDRDVRSIGELDLKPARTDTPRPPTPSVGGRAPAAGYGENVELPLFTDDIPLITKPSPPRAPLSVRRATPEIPRSRSEAPRPASLTFHDPEPSASAAEDEESTDRPGETAEPVPDPRSATTSRLDAAANTSAAAQRLPSPIAAEPSPAGLVARWFAAVIDLSLLAAVDLAVLYLTLQICGLTVAEWNLLPRGPLLAFLVVQNGGYLVAFTAGGQTIGKMMTGIKVIAAEPDQPLDLGRALQRTLLWTAMALPAGLGLFSALLTADRRGLHDRFAGTRVVRAAA